MKDISSIRSYFVMTIKILITIIVTFAFASYYKNMIINKYIVQPETTLVVRQISDIVYYAILIIGFIVILMQFGVEKSTILTFTGTLGFAITLSLQNTLSRGVSGIRIILENIYQIGDRIEVGSNVGYVKDFSIFNTLIHDEVNNVDILLPNDLIDSNALINYNRKI